MAEELHGRQRNRKRIWLALGVVLALLAILIVPPLISINSYKGRITTLISASLGRPVRLSAVELRLLPRPEFVLTDLTVEEDPSYGVEPFLHASTVAAAIRLWPLWRGKLQISRISVDDASLNLVRTTAGRWNLDSFFRTAAQPKSAAGSSGKPLALPYLEATSSRVNIKQGFEKLPYSLVNADFSFWQENPGDWRLRLRGQPARTDVQLDLADTGIVELEASLGHAPQLREIPVRLDMEWRDAQLGQLSRLLLGSDPGWRGDLRGEMHLEGTVESAQITTRLRATGVHRAEFAPADPLDFDANCNFTYHYSNRSLEKLACDSPLGDGHLRVEGSMPGDAPPTLAVELQRIPAQAGLDALRTVRDGFGEGLEARGTISGKLDYSPLAPNQPAAVPPLHRSSKSRLHDDSPAQPDPFTGSLVIEGLRISGGSLSQPIQIQKITFEPTPASAPPVQAGKRTTSSAQTRAQNRAQDSAPHPVLPESLTATVALISGAPTPLTLTLRAALSGYQITMRGPAGIARAREFARVAALPNVASLDALAGDPVTLDLTAEGPWIPAAIGLGATVIPLNPSAAVPDQLHGTVTFRAATWTSAYLASPVEISQATLHLSGSSLVWDPVSFAYGPVKGTASFAVPTVCDPPDQCHPLLELQFATLDTAAVQAALLGAHRSDTLLSSLLARLKPSAPWPTLESDVIADSIPLGPVTLRNAQVVVHILPTGAEFTAIDATLLGGQIHATGKLTAGDKPGYSFEGEFRKLNPAAVCPLLQISCKGTAIDGNGKIELAGFTAQDLSSSAKGTVHFEWRQGSVLGRVVPAAASADVPAAASATVPAATSDSVPAALTRFDRWTADAEISNGALTLKGNQVQQGARKSVVATSFPFLESPKPAVAAPKPAPQSASR